MRVIEQFLAKLLDELDPDALPIEEVIEMFFELAELQHVCASTKSKLERLDPGVAERAQPADASADALHDGLLSVERGSLVAATDSELDGRRAEIEVLPELAFEVTEVLRR
jgi:hypothetical protein